MIDWMIGLEWMDGWVGNFPSLRFHRQPWEERVGRDSAPPEMMGKENRRACIPWRCCIFFFLFDHFPQDFNLSSVVSRLENIGNNTENDLDKADKLFQCTVRGMHGWTLADHQTTVELCRWKE